MRLPSAGAWLLRIPSSPCLGICWTESTRRSTRTSRTATSAKSSSRSSPTPPSSASPANSSSPAPPRTPPPNSSPTPTSPASRTPQPPWGSSTWRVRSPTSTSTCWGRQGDVGREPALRHAELSGRGLQQLQDGLLPVAQPEERAVRGDLRPQPPRAPRDRQLLQTLPGVPPPQGEGPR